MKLSLINEATIKDVEKRIPIWVKNYFIGDQDKANEIIPQVIEADPTKGKYSEWLIKQWKNGTAIFPEDSEKLQEVLSSFDQKKSKLEEKDINKYTPGSLAKVLDQQLGLTKSERKKARKGSMELPPGAEFIGKYDEFEVVRITDANASSLLCSGTKWCVANKDSAESYLKYSPTYLFYENGERKYLAHTESNQYMDVYNDVVEPKIEREMKWAMIRLDPSASSLPLVLDLYRDPQYKISDDDLIVIITAVYEKFANNPTPTSYLESVKKLRDLMYKMSTSDEFYDDIYDDDSPQYKKLKSIADIIKKMFSTMLEAIQADNGSFDVYDIMELGKQDENKIIRQWMERNAEFYEMFSYYYNTDMKGRWKALEDAGEDFAGDKHRVTGIEIRTIQRMRVLDKMIEYATQNNLRIPWIEEFMLSGSVDNNILANKMATYAIESIDGRWLEAEPIIKTNGYAWGRYKYYLNIE
jgi:hypothetical protein